jgi:hypothetical protein
MALSLDAAQPFPEAAMSRKKPTARTVFVLFDVHYEDGSRSSNRKVPSHEIEGLEGDAAAKTFIEAQDEKIAEQSRRPRSSIKSIARSDK